MGRALPPSVSSDLDQDLLCHCAGIGKGRIKAALALAPTSTLETLGAQLGCGMQCGCCKPLIQEMLGQSPWLDVESARRTVLTDQRDPQRRIVQLDMRLAADAVYPIAAPGQHVVVQARLGGRWVARTYTIIGQSTDGREITIAIRRLEGGEFGPQLLDADDAAFAAIALRIAPPNGEAAPQDDRPVVCFVAGVGITLALSMLNGLPDARALHIDYSASHAGDLVYADRIRAAAAGNPRRTCKLRADDTDGFIDEGVIRETAQTFGNHAHYYVCGPAGYTARVTAALRKARVPNASVHVEAFFLQKGQRAKFGWRQMAYAAGLAMAFLPLALLAPDLSGFVPSNPHNPGHQSLECAQCHAPAAGSTRQQLQAKLRYHLGLRETNADFGNRNVDNAVCVDCHEKTDDRHPSYRFWEPRFEAARKAIAPQTCTSCHREHTGVRVSRVDSGFCAQCHADTEVKNDPATPSHAELMAGKQWQTCLTCHDFHGNHAYKAPKDLRQALSQQAVESYLAQGASPYGPATTKAKQRRQTQ